MGTLCLINEKLYFIGRMRALHGYTDKPEYVHPKVGSPIPAKHWRDGHEKGSPFSGECYWVFDYHFYQQWDVKGAAAEWVCRAKRSDDQRPGLSERTPSRLTITATITDYEGEGIVHRNRRRSRPPLLCPPKTVTPSQAKLISDLLGCGRSPR